MQSRVRIVLTKFKKKIFHLIRNVEMQIWHRFESYYNWRKRECDFLQSNLEHHPLTLRILIFMSFRTDKNYNHYHLNILSRVIGLCVCVLTDFHLTQLVIYQKKTDSSHDNLLRSSCIRDEIRLQYSAIVSQWQETNLIISAVGFHASSCHFSMKYLSDIPETCR